ncbi:protein TEX261 [Tropilaelaps mercedesae]|uniref:Protein TEX261 n=1 Tax=Tropilaelaps mercedesae TaxID=418985 RepID=A0A1V9Y3I5_9ACAR|nr:protein TEX261 [Tropilaelaps mercedesae]
MFLYVLSWFATALQLCFVVLCIASGLYYLAEIVEEFTAATARVIRYMIFSTIIIYLCLLVFEDFPMTMLLSGLLSQVPHLLILKTFPFVDALSPSFIASAVLVVWNHYQAFSFFSSMYFPFSEVLAYFTLCLWAVPFAFIVSLSANDAVLPTRAERQILDDDDPFSQSFNFAKRGLRKSSLLTLFRSARESILPQRVKRAF